MQARSPTGRCFLRLRRSGRAVPSTNRDATSEPGISQGSCQGREGFGDGNGERFSRGGRAARTKSVLHRSGDSRDADRADPERGPLQGVGEVRPRGGSKVRIDDPRQKAAALVGEESEQFRGECGVAECLAREVVGIEQHRLRRVSGIGIWQNILAPGATAILAIHS